MLVFTIISVAFLISILSATALMGLFKGFSPDQIESADSRNLLKEKENGVSKLHESSSDKVREEIKEVGDSTGI